MADTGNTVVSLHAGSGLRHPMTTDIAFRRGFEFEYGALQAVSPLVRRVVARNPGPFTFTGTGTYVIGREQVAIIDPGPLLDEHVDALLQGLRGESVTHLLITHTHLDHSPAARIVKERTGARVLGFGPHGDPAHGGSGEAGADHDFAPEESLGDGDVVAGPGWTLSAVYTPGHTSNHLCFALAEEQALFTGDHVMGWSTSVISPPDGDMGAYVESLHKLLRRDDAIYWPTHGPAIREPRPHVASFIAHRREREQEILDALKAGAATIEEMVSAIYTDIKPVLLKAAGRSVHAHLIDLNARGLVACEGEPSPNSRYRTIR